MVLESLEKFARGKYYLYLGISFLSLIMLVVFSFLAMVVISGIFYLAGLVLLFVLSAWLLYYSIKKMFHYHSKLIDIMDELIRKTKK